MRQMRSGESGGPSRGLEATTPARSRQLPRVSRTRRGLDERAWSDAVDAERLIRVSEWAVARQLELRSEHDIALTPKALDVVERVPYAEIGTSTAVARMSRLVRFVERLLELGLPACVGRDTAFELAVPLTSRPGIAAVRLRAYVDLSGRRVALCTGAGDHPIGACGRPGIQHRGSAWPAAWVDRAAREWRVLRDVDQGRRS